MYGYWNIIVVTDRRRGGGGEGGGGSSVLLSLHILVTFRVLVSLLRLGKQCVYR